MRKLEAGRLRHVVTFEEPTLTQNPTTGEIVTTWTPAVTTRAAFEPLSARELMQAQAVKSEVTARLVVRFRDDLTPNMRVRLGEHIFNITGLIPDPITGREWLTIPCFK